jgi:hypothetical protein
MTNGAWPNLFVVGATRAGTTSLWRYLDRHPDIWMSPVKEPNFFSGLQPRFSRLYADEASYLRLFAPGAGYRLRGEASPSYLWPERVPAAIKRVSPQARIVISLRDPVERAYSAYWQAVRLGDERLSFLEAVQAEIGDPSRPLSRYLVPSSYADPVKRYLDTFGDAVHVLFFEELAEDARRETRRIFEFLDLKADVADQLDAAAHNPFALPRNQAARIVHNSQRIRAAARAVVPLGLRLRMVNLLLKQPPKPEMEPEAQELLAAHFAPDVERLRGVLGRVPWTRYAR